MLINYSEHINRLNDFRKGKVKESLTLGIKEIDSHFRFVHSNLVMWLGFPNIGKTHFVIYIMMLYAIKHNLRFLIFSSENDPVSLIRKMIEFYFGLPINRIEEADYQKGVDFVDRHFKFVDCSKQYTYMSLLSLATNIKNAWDYDCLMVDPINSLKKEIKVGSNSFEYGYEQLTELRIFSKKYNVATWVCLHTNTEALRKVHPKGHDFEGQPAVPNYASAENGQMNASRSCDFVTLHRYIYDKRDWMYTRMYVSKVKNQELGYRPNSMNEPIMWKSIINNVGFEIAGQNPVPYPTKKQLTIDNTTENSREA